LKIDLSGKVALVTGGTRGIGHAIARALARAGARVALLARDGGRAQETAKALGDGTGRGYACDVADARQVETVVAAVEQDFGRVDVLVNNAGVFGRSNFLELGLEDWNKTIAVNLTGPFLCIQEAARAMLGNEGPVRGRIVNITSTAAVLAEQEGTDYNASKGGLAQLSRSAAVELAPHGILCNSVAPGWVSTEIDADYVASLSPEQVRRMNPLAREADPDEIAHVVASACDERATFMTGASILVDGGQTAVATLPA